MTVVDLSPLKNLTTIGDKAFHDVSDRITSLNFGELPKLKIIGANAFTKRTKNSYGNFVLSSNLKLDQLDLSGLTGLEVIGENAFAKMECDDTKLIGLTSLREIGTNAFVGGLGSPRITIKDLPQMRTIGKRFKSCTLPEIDLRQSVHLEEIKRDTFEQYFINADLVTVLYLPEPQGDIEPALKRIGNLHSGICFSRVVIADMPHLTYIGNRAFAHGKTNAELTLRNLPSLTQVDYLAFCWRKTYRSYIRKCTKFN